MDCDRGQPQRSNWSGCVITTEGVYLNAGKGSAGSTTSQYLDSQSLIVRRMLHPIWVCIDKLTRLVRELSIKRGRTEVSASFNFGSAGAVGRHTKNSENLILMVSAVGTRIPLGDGRDVPPPHV